MNDIFTVSQTFQATYPITGLPLDDASLCGPVASEFSFDATGLSMAVILKHLPCVTWILNVRNQSFDLISDNTLEYLDTNICTLREGTISSTKTLCIRTMPPTL